MNRLFGLQHRGVGSGDHFEMKICPEMQAYLCIRCSKIWLFMEKCVFLPSS